ncbi:MAG: hypothetical protein AAF718_07360 [Pseudomonadota bacterium]
MRVLLALMFVMPAAMLLLVQSGADRVTPALLAIGIGATALQIYLERKEKRA